MTDPTIKGLLDAITQGKPELILRGATIVDVFTRTLRTGDVAVAQGRVLGVGHYDGAPVYDATGAFLSPGLIDAHVHIESSCVTPARFAEAVLAQGTTALIADPHEIANVLGADGVQAMLDLSDDLPLDVRVMLPSCVPATPFEHNGAAYTVSDMRAQRDHPRVLGLGEVMDADAVVSGDPEMLEKLSLFADRPIDGHAPLLTGPALQAYCAAGVSSDHECSQFDEVIEKLQNGLFIQLRMGSAAKGITEIFRALAASNHPLDAFALCTDDKHLADIVREGHINHMLQVAVSCGIAPVDAIRMATLNPARHYGLRGVGGIAPGYAADFVLFDDLADFRVRAVFTKGTQFNGQVQAPPVSGAFKNSVHIGPLTDESFRLRVGPSANVIHLVPDQLLTQLERRAVSAVDGVFCANEVENKLAVIERHNALPHIGLGIVCGLGIKNGAIAATVAHDSHNLIVAGDNDRDMRLAAETLADCGGGYAVLSGGRVLACLPLPIAGLMTDLPVDRVIAGQEAVLQAARALGVPPGVDPMITLSFLALPVIPAVRLTDLGLFDVLRRQFLPV